MRTYTIRQGINKGQHCIFDSPDEASIKLSKEFASLNIKSQPLLFDNGNTWKMVGDTIFCVFPHWLSLTEPSQSGLWVCSDDGRVLQCLNFYLTANNKRVTFKNGTDCRTKSVKTAIGVYYSFPHADGTFQAMKMVADAKFDKEFIHNKSSFSNNKTVLGAKMNDRKRMFAYYMYISGDPVRSLSAVHRNKRSRLSNMYLVKSALSLLKDEGVLAEIKKYLPTPMAEENFRTKLKLALDKKNVNLETLAEHVGAGLEANLQPVQAKDVNGNLIFNKDGSPRWIHNPKTGGIAHQGFIKMAVDLVKFANDEIDDATDTKKIGSKSTKEAIPIEGVRFQEEILPPPKSIKDKVDVTLLKKD